MCVILSVCVCVWLWRATHIGLVADPKILKKGRKTIYQLRPHLSKMRTTKYMPFTRKNGFLRRIWASRGCRPTPFWIRHCIGYTQPELNKRTNSERIIQIWDSLTGYDDTRLAVSIDSRSIITIPVLRYQLIEAQSRFDYSNCADVQLPVATGGRGRASAHQPISVQKRPRWAWPESWRHAAVRCSPPVLDAVCDVMRDVLMYEWRHEWRVVARPGRVSE